MNHARDKSLLVDDASSIRQALCIALGALGFKVEEAGDGAAALARALGSAQNLFLIGDVELDPNRRTVKKRGQPVHLTPKEFDVLHHLMANAGMPVPHAKLLKAVWGPEYGNELEYLRTFVRQLRIKIEDDPSNPTYLLTEPYVGYRFYEPSHLQPLPGSGIEHRGAIAGRHRA